MNLTKHVLYHARQYRYPRPIDFLANRETLNLAQFQNCAIGLSQAVGFDEVRKVRGFCLETREILGESVSVIKPSIPKYYQIGTIFAYVVFNFSFLFTSSRQVLGCHNFP